MYDTHEIFAFDSLSGVVEDQGVFNDQVYINPDFEIEPPEPQPVPILDGTWWCDFDPAFS